MSFDNLQSAQTIAGDRAKVLLHGRTGSGKSTLAGSMADVGSVLYTYFPGEEGINSVKGLPNDDRIFLNRVDNLSKLEENFQDLLAGDHNINTVVIDSVTALQTCLTKTLMGLDWTDDLPSYEGRGYGFWGDLGNWFTDFFTNWYALASHDRQNPINVVMTAQTAMKEIEGMDVTRFLPDLSKGPLGPALSRPDFIFFTQVEDPESNLLGGDEGGDQPNFTVRVKPSENIEAKTHTDVTKALKVPAVLRVPENKDRLTLPMILKALGISIK